MDISQNLSPVRGPSVWSRDLTPASGRPIPRILFAGCGLGLLAAALTSRRGVRRALLTCLGTSMVAAAGAGPRFSGLACGARRMIDRWRNADPVTEASEESFPASDSPSWTPAAAGAPDRLQG